LQGLHLGTVPAPPAWEFNANGKQLDLPKLKVQLLNGQLPLYPPCLLLASPLLWQLVACITVPAKKKWAQA
jgi:hypothetical protein